MVHVVTQAAVCESLECWCLNRSAKYATSPKTNVVRHYQQHIRRTLRRFDTLWKIRCRVLHSTTNLPIERRFGLWKDFLTHQAWTRYQERKHWQKQWKQLSEHPHEILQRKGTSQTDVLLLGGEFE